ncbi:MAG: signal peptidase I [Planctomycetota bacterium]|jgi:signal peptidase I
MSSESGKAHAADLSVRDQKERALDPGLPEELSLAQLLGTTGEEHPARGGQSTQGEGRDQHPARRFSNLSRLQADLDYDSNRLWGPVAHWVARFSLRFAILSLLAWGLLFNFSEVRGSSMQPGIHDRDRILVDHLSYWVGNVQRGDIVVLRYPLDPSLDYIKRIVGLPGEEVRIEGGQLWIDGRMLNEPYIAAECIDPFTRLVTRVKEDHFFVLGDNRLRSSDSREFGQVPRSHLRGKVRVRLWPPERVGLID